jgi:hypothetical protein
MRSCFAVRVSRSHLVTDARGSGQLRRRPFHLAALLSRRAIAIDDVRPELTSPRTPSDRPASRCSIPSRSRDENVSAHDIRVRRSVNRRRGLRATRSGPEILRGLVEAADRLRVDRLCMERADNTSHRERRKRHVTRSDESGIVTPSPRDCGHSEEGGGTIAEGRCAISAGRAAIDTCSCAHACAQRMTATRCVSVRAPMRARSR